MAKIAKANTDNINPIHTYHQLASRLFRQLGDPVLSDDRRAAVVRQLRSIVSSILLTIDTLDGLERVSLIEALADGLAMAALPLLKLGDNDYDVDLKARLDIVYDIMSALDELASSAALEMEEKVPLIDAAKTIINPAWCLAARLVDADHADYGTVSNREINLGREALLTAWRASVIVEDRGRELRQAGIVID